MRYQSTPEKEFDGDIIITTHATLFAMKTG